QAGADEHITADHNEAFEQALSDAGVEHELVAYEGAPHSFFDRKQEEFAGASDDAWKRTLEFIGRHSQISGKPGGTRPHRSPRSIATPRSRHSRISSRQSSTRTRWTR